MTSMGEGRSTGRTLNTRQNTSHNTTKLAEPSSGTALRRMALTSMSRALTASVMDQPHAFEDGAHPARVVGEFRCLAQRQAPLCRQVDGNVLDHVARPRAEHDDALGEEHRL